MKKNTFNCTLFTRDLRLKIECPELDFQQEIMFGETDEWSSILIRGIVYDVHLLLEGVGDDDRDEWEVSIYRCRETPVGDQVTDYSDNATQLVNLVIHDTGNDDEEEALEFVVYHNPDINMVTVNLPNGAEHPIYLPPDLPMGHFMYEGKTYTISKVTEFIVHDDPQVSIKIHSEPTPDNYVNHIVICYRVYEEDTEDEDEELEEADCIAREYEWSCVSCGCTNVIWEWVETSHCSRCGKKNKISLPEHAYK